MCIVKCKGKWKVSGQYNLYFSTTLIKTQEVWSEEKKIYKKIIYDNFSRRIFAKFLHLLKDFFEFVLRSPQVTCKR